MSSSQFLGAREDSGAMAVFVGLLAVVLIGIAALAVDIGWAYSDRRQMQNAADAASMAGTRQLVAARWTPDAARTNWALDNVKAQDLSAGSPPKLGVVPAVLVANGAIPNDFKCEVINESRGRIADCDDWSTWMSAGGANVPVGVRVIAKSVRTSALGGIFGANKIAAAALSTAQVKNVTGGGGPFLVCAYDQVADKKDGGKDLPDILLPADITDLRSAAFGGTGTGTATPPWKYPSNPPFIPVGAADWSINPDALSKDGGLTGPEYVLHDSQVSRCGADASKFKGLAEETIEGTIPGEFNTKPGDKAGPTRADVANQCKLVDTKDDPEGCVMTVPICVQATEPGPAKTPLLWCVKLGAFLLTDTGAQYHQGRLLGSVVVNGPYSTSGTPRLNEPTSISLVE